MPDSNATNDGNPLAAYVALHRSGELARRAEAAVARLEKCDICPRGCAVDRLNDARKACATGRLARISSVGPHFGEESPLVGRRGSGTIFFSGCNLSCLFCQNADISRGPGGREVEPAQLADAMLAVQEMGCHNLNLVSPTHVTAQILEALALAVDGGLQIPIVYNCGGYESLDTLALLDGVVDIYMPDFKYTDPEVGRRYSGVPDYPEVAMAALKEMHRQVGDLVIAPAGRATPRSGRGSDPGASRGLRTEVIDQGVARRGMLIRHLVLPDDQSGTAAAMRFIADELSRETYVNVMDQYRPCGPACTHAGLGRPITRTEYRAAVEAALEAGLTRLDDRRTRLQLLFH